MKGNLALHTNPCCGFETNCSSELGEIEPELASPGDLTICLNCGAILAYLDPEKNVTRFARRLEVDLLSRRLKKKLSIAQRLIRKRGWLPSEASRVAGN